MNSFVGGMTLSTEVIVALALMAAAAASLLIGATLIARARALKKQAHRLDEAVAQRSGVVVKRDKLGWRARIVNVGLKGVTSSLGKSFVAAEDRQLLDQCGIDHPSGRAWFFIARTALGFGLPLIGWFFFGGHSFFRGALAVFFGFGIGYMGPKWYLGKRAAKRRTQADQEMPLLVDLLRLLQGVGMSVDQSMQLIEQDFLGSMPVLVAELGHASAQYRSGQTREASFQRFAKVYGNDDMASIAELIVQVDRFGGGVQEPLRQFGERMRERRRFDMKARIGKLTVKMTGVMVVTLLPALVIVTGGAGFLAILRGLTSIAGR